MISIFINEVRFTGHLTDAPVLKQVGDTKVVNFSLGQTRRYKDKNDVEKEDVTFIDCEIWGARAEALAKHAAKGTGLYIAARIKQDQWEDKESGKKRSKVVFVVEEWQFAEPRKEDKERKDAARDAQALLEKGKG